MGWFFLLLGVGFSCVALQPAWRKRWSWGRQGGGAPLSAFAWSAWIAFAFVTSAAGFESISPVWVLVAMMVIVVAAIYDSIRYSRRRATNR